MALAQKLEQAWYGDGRTPGWTYPLSWLYAGATGHVLLAGMDPAKVEEYIASTKLQPLQPLTITDVAVLRRKIEEVRRLGYALSAGEVNVGIAAMSAPITDQSGKTIAALSVSYSAKRFTAKLRQNCLTCILEGARTISRQVRFLR